MSGIASGANWADGGNAVAGVGAAAAEEEAEDEVCCLSSISTRRRLPILATPQPLSHAIKADRSDEAASFRARDHSRLSLVPICAGRSLA